MRPRGFTLFEMLAVILLLGLAAAAVSVPVSQGLASARVNAASGELASALRYTRMQAIVQGKEQKFLVDVAGPTYQSPGRDVQHLPEGMKLAVNSAKADQSNTQAAIRFFPDGSSTGGRITLSRGTREWRVNVAWLTGAISVDRE
jgi:general secretion pathway protein H